MLIVRHGKGNKMRKIPLNKNARKALMAYLEKRPESESQAVFLNQSFKPIHTKTVQRAVTRFVQAADMEEITPHILRHTFAKNLINNDVSIEKVAALLGHNNINTTRIYIFPDENDLEEAVNGLEG
jgi:integrase/recombinase XerC